MVFSLISRKAVSVRFVVALLIVVLPIVVLMWLRSPMCTNQVLLEVVSPDQRYKVVVFLRDCGATTNYSSHVSIVPARHKITNRSGGNVFIADTDHGRAPAGINGAPEVEVAWQSANELSIRYNKAVRIFKSIDELHAIEVRLEPVI